MSSCPSAETIDLFVNARLSGPRSAAMEDHVETCSACQAILEQLATLSSESEIQRPERSAPRNDRPRSPVS